MASAGVVTRNTERKRVGTFSPVDWPEEGRGCLEIEYYKHCGKLGSFCHTVMFTLPYAACHSQKCQTSQIRKSIHQTNVKKTSRKLLQGDTYTINRMPEVWGQVIKDGLRWSDWESNFIYFHSKAGLEKKHQGIWKQKSNPSHSPSGLCLWLVEKQE